MKLNNRPKVFFFHYNKPLSKQMGRNILSIHFDKQCHFVEELECNVPIRTHSRKTQPRCVIKGKGIVSIIDKKAVIN